MGESIRLELMAESHLDAITAIESVSFSFPWQRSDFLLAMSRENSFCRVVLFAGGVVGYLVGFVTGHEFHLADFAIAPTHRRCGFGQQALDCLLVSLDRHIQVVTLEVRMSNAAAIGLYKRQGFQTMAIQRDYYRQPEEDALVMVKTLQGPLSDWVLQAYSKMVETRENA